jgi:hypothetical protein
LRCSSSTTKGVIVITCYNRLLTYMMNGMGYSAGGCLDKDPIFHRQIWVHILQVGLCSKPVEV